MASSSKSDNIILGILGIGSTKTAIEDTLSKEDKVSTDMDFIDKVMENVMIQLIHTLVGEWC